MLITHLLMALLILMPSSPGSPAIIDRQLLEVESNSYTQRHFEIYFLVRQLLLSRNSKPDLALRQENWERELQNFKNEMLINHFMDQETQRLSSLFPNKSMLETAFDMVQNRSQKVTAAQEISKRLQIHEDELRRALTQILKVQSYLKSRTRLLEVGADVENWGYELDDQSAWFTRIEQTFRYRFYDDAKQYVEIRWE